jgi:hypothetical protein
MSEEVSRKQLITVAADNLLGFDGEIVKSWPLTIMPQRLPNQSMTFFLPVHRLSVR